MKVYFGASISLDRSMLPVYQKIVGQIRKLGHTVVSEQVVDPHFIPGGGQSAKKLFAQETKQIEKADVMVAEVSKPSWGTAFLMEHALEHGKRVLALFYKEAQRPMPLMIKGHPELYVEHYDEDNIGTVLKKNLTHFDEVGAKKGKLVVIDGADGSGKSTQTKLLLAYFKKQGLAHKFISFPRYETSFHGRHVGRFLRGEFGGNDEVNPYLSSLAYALDRLTAREQLVEWLAEGNVVLADRYVSATLAHQGSKMSGRKQKEFLDWVYTMEYKEHKLPREDLVIYLYVPAKIAQKLLRKGSHNRDMADVDEAHQKRSMALYKKLVKQNEHWVMVTSVDSQGKLLSVDKIHRKILQILKEREII